MSIQRPHAGHSMKCSRSSCGSPSSPLLTMVLREKAKAQAAGIVADAKAEKAELEAAIAKLKPKLAAAEDRFEVVNSELARLRRAVEARV
jgi:hypothetical protein